MNKINAALIHLTISVFLIGIFALIVFYVWYPYPFTNLASVTEPLYLLITVDVIIGPLLTFIIYKKGKKHLILDLTVIGVLQIIAFIYGIYIINQGRPTIVVFHKGEFHYLSKKYANHNELKYDNLKPHIFSSPKLAYISKTNAKDIYNAYGDMQPLDDFETMLLPHSLNVDNLTTLNPIIENVIENIDVKFIDEEIVYFLLTKNKVKYIVVYSVTQNNIVDYLEF
jgi:hypothetical protein